MTLPHPVLIPTAFRFLLRVRTQLEFQVARPQTPSWWFSSSSSSSSDSPSTSQRPPEHQSPALDRRRRSSSLLFQARGGGREGDTEGAYRLVCSEDFEHHVLQFLTHQAMSGGQSQGTKGLAGAGMNSSSSNIEPAFKIYSPDQQVRSVACAVHIGLSSHMICAVHIGLSCVCWQ